MKQKALRILKFTGIGFVSLTVLVIFLVVILSEPTSVQINTEPTEVITVEEEDDSQVESIEENEVEESSSVTPTEHSIQPPEQIQEESQELSGQTYTVSRVVDGDTVDLNIDGEVERVRLIGIDTPETVHPSKPVECFGLEATKKAKSLLEGKQVQLVVDPSQGERDFFGRLLGYIILPDGRDFGKVMIQDGYAYEYTYGTAYKNQGEYKQAQQYAEINNMGLWAPGVCENWESNQDQSSNTGTNKWYVSSHHSSQYYYCEESDGWKNLSESFLKTYDTEAELKKDYPNHTLHYSCQ